MKKLEVYMGILLMALGLGFYMVTLTLPEQVSLYPKFVSLLLLVFSTLFVIQTMFRPNEEYQDRPFEGIYVRQMMFIIGISFIYVVLIKTLGFFLATSLYVVVGTRGLKIPFKNAVATAIGVNVALYGIFVFMLNVPLPKGILM